MFKPIMQGMFGPMAVNRKLKQIWEAIDAINALNEPVLDPVRPVEQVKPVEEPEGEKAFDWQTSDDATLLKEYALLELGLTIKGNKKSETVRAEIEGFLTTQGV